MRMQLVPLPAMKPLQPSSFHIFAKALPTPSLYSLWPALCTCRRIFNRSRGDTTVRETAPATPPAQKAATTGCEIKSRNWDWFAAAAFAALMASSEDYKNSNVSISYSPSLPGVLCFLSTAGARTAVILFVSGVSCRESSRGCAGVRKYYW